MTLLCQRECGREWCVDPMLRFTMWTFRAGVQFRVDDQRGIAVDADLPFLSTKAGRAQAADFLERFPPASRAMERIAARKGRAAGHVTVLLRAAVCAG